MGLKETITPIKTIYMKSVKTENDTHQQKPYESYNNIREKKIRTTKIEIEGL